MNICTIVKTGCIHYQVHEIRIISTYLHEWSTIINGEKMILLNVIDTTYKPIYWSIIFDANILLPKNPLIRFYFFKLNLKKPSEAERFYFMKVKPHDGLGFYEGKLVKTTELSNDIKTNQEGPGLLETCRSMFASNLPLLKLSSLSILISTPQWDIQYQSYCKQKSML